MSNPTTDVHATGTAHTRSGSAMTTNGPPATPRDTWQDWMGPGMRQPVDGELLTRAELVRRLLDRGVLVTPRTVLHWETQGALPRPVRRWYRGATRSTYPRWVIEVAAQVPALRRAGLSFPEIGNRLRASLAERTDATVMAGTATATAAAGGASVSGGGIRHTTVSDSAGLGSTDAASVAVAPPAPPTDAELEGALARFARRYHAASGIPVAAVEVRVTDTDGRERVHHFPPARGVTPPT